MKQRYTGWAGVQQRDRTLSRLVNPRVLVQLRQARSLRLPRGEAARGGARRAGPRPRQLLSKMDAMRPPRRRSIAASASSADLGRPGAWAQPARTVDGRGWLRQQALSSRTRHPQRPCPGTNIRRRGAEQAWPARLPLALRHPPWPGAQVLIPAGSQRGRFTSIPAQPIGKK